MLDVTVLFLVAGVLLAGLHDTEARAAWLKADWGARLRSALTLQLVFGGTITLVGLAYAAAILRDSPHFADLSLSLRTLRPIAALLLPSIVMGLLAGIVLRLALGQRSVQLFLVGALFFILPFALSSGAGVLRYVREIKTPWFEASLQSTEAQAPVAIQLEGLLDRSADWANPLETGDYLALLDQARMDARLERLAAARPMELVHLAASNGAPLWSPREIVPAWELGELPAELRFAQAYFAPLLVCIWQHEGSPRAERLIREAVEPVASAAARTLQLPWEGGGPAGSDPGWWEETERFRRTLAQAHAQFAGLPEAPAEGAAKGAGCITDLLVPGWTGEKSLGQCRDIRRARSFCSFVPFLPVPQEIAARALPHILIARLFRRVGYDGTARTYLAAIDTSAMSPEQKGRLLLERANLARELGYTAKLDDLQGAIGQRMEALAAIHPDTRSDIARLGCEDHTDPRYPLRVLLALAEFDLAQMRNLLAFQLVSTAANRLPIAEPESIREALLMARDNYERLGHITELECFLEHPEAFGPGFTMDVGITFPDTYALALLVGAAQPGTERLGIEERILGLLDEAEAEARRSGPSARSTFLPILDQHRRIAAAAL